MGFKSAVKIWTADINDSYDINATDEEVIDSYFQFFSDKFAYDDTSYVDKFFKDKAGNWLCWLDTADREGLADGVSELRANLA
jgi:hypothetical protein